MQSGVGVAAKPNGWRPLCMIVGGRAAHNGWLPPHLTFMSPLHVVGSPIDKEEAFLRRFVALQNLDATLCTAKIVSQHIDYRAVRLSSLGYLRYRDPQHTVEDPSDRVPAAPGSRLDVDQGPLGMCMHFNRF